MSRDCLSCGGKCCVAWGGALPTTPADAERFSEYAIDGELWFDPETGERLTACPFFHEGKCTIYPKDEAEDIRPAICRNYPWDQKCINDTMKERTTSDGINKLDIAFFSTKRIS